MSLGRSQHQLQAAPVLPVRRRSSGGGAVLAGPWQLRAAVRLPRGDALLRHGPASLANWLGQVLLVWLQARGVADARLHQGRGCEHWACFAGRGPGEVLVGGRKLAGIAQVWQRSGVLATAAILLEVPPWPLLCEALGHPAAQAADLARTTISLRECLGAPVVAADCAGSLAAALREALARTQRVQPRSG